MVIFMAIIFAPWPIILISNLYTNSGTVTAAGGTFGTGVVGGGSGVAGNAGLVVTFQN